MDMENGSTKSLVELFREASTEIRKERGETIDDPPAKCVEIVTKDGETKQVSSLEFWEQMIKEVEEQKEDPDYLFAPPVDQLICETFTVVLENPTSEEASVCWKGVYYTPRPSSFYLQNLDLGIDQTYLALDVRPPRKVIKVLRRIPNISPSSSEAEITKIMELIHDMESLSPVRGGNRSIDLTLSSFANGDHISVERRNQSTTIDCDTSSSDDEITKMMERIHGIGCSTPTFSANCCIDLTLTPTDESNISERRNIKLTIVDCDELSTEDDITKMMEQIHGMECSSLIPNEYLHPSYRIDLTSSPYKKNNSSGEGKTINLTTSENGVSPILDWNSRNMERSSMDDDLLKILADDISIPDNNKNLNITPDWESQKINITDNDFQERNINLASITESFQFQYMHMSHRSRRQFIYQHGRSGIQRQFKLHNPCFRKRGYRVQRYLSLLTSAFQQIVLGSTQLSRTCLKLRSLVRLQHSFSYSNNLSKLLAPYQVLPWDFQLTTNQTSPVQQMYTKMSYEQGHAVYWIPTTGKELPQSVHAHIKAQNPWIPQSTPIGINTAVWQYFPAVNNQIAHEKWLFKVPVIPRHPHINTIRAHKATYVPHYRQKNQQTFRQK